MPIFDINFLVGQNGSAASCGWSRGGTESAFLFPDPNSQLGAGLKSSDCIGGLDDAIEDDTLCPVRAVTLNDLQTEDCNTPINQEGPKPFLIVNC